VSAFGRSYPPGRLYTIAGDGNVGAANQADAIDARNFQLNFPTGLALDTAGNVFLLDSIEGEVRVILNAANTAANQGKIYTLNLKDVGGTAPFLADGGQDLKVVDPDGNPATTPNYLYVVDTNHHRVVRTDLGNLNTLDATAGNPLTVGVVMGVKDEPGYLRAGLTYPDIHDVSKALPEADARLNAPTSIAFDSAGNMIVADRARLHMLEAASLDPAVAGNTYVIAGGLDTRFLVGDARLGYFPSTAQIQYDPTSRNVLVCDPKENLVRRLWTARGTY
jgi:hypothetical protein